MGTYLNTGSLQRDGEHELIRLRDSAEANVLPTTPAGRLQSSLYLLRVALDVLALIIDGRRDQAKQLLVSALEESEAAAENPPSPVDPFDGMLFVLGTRLAEDAGDTETGERMRQRVELLKNQLLNEDEAMVALLESYLASD